MINIVDIFTSSAILINFVAVAIGIVFGFLPGLSATMGVAILLPFTFGMNPISAFALLLGVYVGGIYGGSITAILIRTPGTPASAATVLDGYPLTEQGRAQEALSAATISSFIGGIFSCVVLVMLSGVVADFALKFGPPEYFAVGLFGLSIVSSLSGNNILKGLIAAGFGLMLSTIGLDPVSGSIRFTLGMPNMMGGIQLVSALIGLFAISEILSKLEGSRKVKAYSAVKLEKGKLISLSTLAKNTFNFIRSSVIGTVVGIIPGTGSGTASWLAYNEAMRASKHPEQFGKGAVEGVVASETANNAVTGGALIPLLTLGVPGDTVTAVLLGSLMIQGLTPGPSLFANYPEVVSGIYVLMIISNIFMVILGLLGVNLFLKVLKVPSNVLMPCVLVLCCVGSFAIRNSVFDIKVALVMGAVGYLFTKAGFPIPPALLGLILGNIIESNYRRAMTMSQGDPSIFFTRPICLVFIAISIFAFCWPFMRAGLVAIKGKNTAKKPEAGQ